MKLIHSVLLAALVASCIRARTFTVHNTCSYTVWPAIFTDLNVAQNTPNYTTGWEAKPGSSVSFTVPNDWKSGRIWGRLGCDFTKNPGPNSCLTGGCNGRLLCDPHSGTGVPPASLAEWTLNGGGVDWYDVSLVDGFNIPMRISNNRGCPVADCPVDLNAICPTALKGPADPSGKVAGCKSSCLAGLCDSQGNSPNCCTGTYGTPDKCPRDGVAYYYFFKRNCPNAYAYAYDEASGTALFTCDSSLLADYTLTFCP